MLGQLTFKTSFKSRLAVVLAAVFCALSASAAGLNDTGQTSCYDAADVAVACSATVGGDTGVNPRQDGRYGRDPRFAAGGLSKIGAGDAGFDFTKVGNNGSVLLPTAALGANPTDWACTRDNVTGLLWEVKGSIGLRNDAHTYTWYSTDATTNGGNAGAVGTDTCGGTLAAAPYSNQCNSQNYVAAVNSAALCGATDWRLPTRRELLTIVHSGVAPSIDMAYFPNTTSFGPGYWTRTTEPQGAAGVFVVTFNDGTVPGTSKIFGGKIRLVRGG